MVYNKLQPKEYMGAYKHAALNDYICDFYDTNGYALLTGSAQVDQLLAASEFEIGPDFANSSYASRE